MAKKRTAEEVILDGFDLETRKQHPTMSKMTNDEFIGYITAMSNYQNLKEGIGIEEYLKTARRLVSEGKV